jgi:hypothetical protein
MKNVDASPTLPAIADATFADTLIGLGQESTRQDGVDGVREIAIRHEDHTGAASLAVSLQAALIHSTPAMIAVSVVNGDRLQLASSTPSARIQGLLRQTSWKARSCKALSPAASCARSRRAGGSLALGRCGVHRHVPPPSVPVNERYMVLNIAGGDW